MRHGLRGWGALAAFILILGFVWLLGHAAEPGKGQPPDKTRPPEQEETVRPKTKKLKDLDPDKVEEPAARPAETPASDLVQALRSVRNGKVKDLYEKLAVPYDRMVRANGHEENIKPIQPLIQDNVQNLPPNMQIVPLVGADKKPGKPFERIPKLAKIVPYEEEALMAVKKFLDQKLETLAQTDPYYLSRLDQLAAAEVVLNAVGRYHISAIELRERSGPGWNLVQGKLRSELFNVLLLQLQELTASRRLEPALALARRLWDTYTKDQEQVRIAKPVLAILKQAQKAPASADAVRSRLREWRQLLGELDGRKPSPEISAALKEQAQALFNQAQRASATKEEEGRAQDLLEQAEETWPNLPDLREFRQKMNQIRGKALRVGVRSLPKFLSPGWAVTDSERRAVELMFEGLMKVSPEADGTLRYRPGLAQGRPQVIALGRQFQLPRAAFWSDGQPLTLADVRYTVRRLKEGGATGRSPAWGDLLEDIPGENDPLRVSVTLKQGYLEPLSLMTFKILPQPAVAGPQRGNPDAFARDPLGSGPFKYEGNRVEGGGPCAVFVANPNYGSRAGKTGLPRIGEIRFLVCDNPVADFKARRVDMVLDLTGKQLGELEQQAGALKVTLPAPLPGNRRVYFLAVNHRVELLKNADLRRAIARAIDREKILDYIFRPDGRRTFHKALNSLLPANSWALDPKVMGKGKDSQDPFDEGFLLKTFVPQVLAKEGLKEIKLSLKYPMGDEDVRKAVESIRDQLQAVKGIVVELEEREPRELKKVVEKTHDYQLAYYHYDYPDDTCNLQPLLGEHGLKEGGNYLGYENPGVSVVLQQVQGLRDFVAVREKMQGIHQMMVNLEMPVIPLWQLDPLLAVHKDVKWVPFDPWLVFTDIEQWKLDRP